MAKKSLTRLVKSNVVRFKICVLFLKSLALALNDERRFDFHQKSK